MKANVLVQNTAASADSAVAHWMAGNSVQMTRMALGVVFLWFGFLKFFPGVSDAEQIAAQTIFKLSFGYIPAHISMPVLALWECLIGIGLLSGRFLRVTVTLLFLQMPGTFLPFLFFPDLTWKHFPYAPTLLGQYIIKNLVLICAGLLIGGTMRGGRVIADPQVADRAYRVQRIVDRFKRRFRRSPEKEVVGRSFRAVRASSVSASSL